jgi:hypothetical protein
VANDVTVKWYGDKVIRDAERGMEDALTQLANDIVKHGRKLMTGAKSGNDYRTAMRKELTAKRTAKGAARRAARG